MLKLSEAIRLGSTLGPQAFGSIATVDGKSCALGAALQAIGLKVKVMDGKFPYVQFEDGVSSDPATHWLWIIQHKVQCPVCGIPVGYAAMVHLNDEHRWSREQIADFVATIEPCDPVASEGLNAQENTVDESAHAHSLTTA